MVEAVDPGTTVFGIRRSEQPNQPFEVYMHKHGSVSYTRDEFENMTRAFVEFLHFVGQHGDVDDAVILEPETAAAFIEQLDKIAAAADE